MSDYNFGTIQNYQHNAEILPQVKGEYRQPVCPVEALAYIFKAVNHCELEGDVPIGTSIIVLKYC